MTHIHTVTNSNNYYLSMPLRITMGFELPSKKYQDHQNQYTGQLLMLQQSDPGN
jgi:hypothetical protein